MPLEKIEKVLGPCRTNRQEIDEEFRRLYTKMIAHLQAERQKKRSHREKRDDSELMQMTQRVVAAGDLLQQVIKQEGEIVRALGAEVARQMTHTKKRIREAQSAKQKLIQDMDQIDHRRVKVEGAGSSMQDQINSVQRQLVESRKNESAYSNMIVEAHQELKRLQHSLAEFEHQVERKKRAQEESKLSQSRLQQLHRAQEGYSREKRLHLNESEKQLIAKRQQAQTLQQQMAYQAQELHCIHAAMDELILRAQQLEQSDPWQIRHIPSQQEKYMFKKS